MKDVQPHLIVDVTLYPTNQGGRSGPTLRDWFGCPCKLRKEDFDAWDCRILLGERPLSPGETRRVGIAFLSGERAATLFRAAGRFFLWEGKIIGEATVVAN